ncbi:MAG: hypothetical protein IKW81_05390 [Pseudobutyrivibrio sp.]|nr:hypothetical protein [Pseudobutyrivibrio sp.]
MKKRIIIIAVVLVVSLQLFILGYRNYKTRMDLHTNSSYSVEMVNPGVFSRTEDEKTDANLTVSGYPMMENVSEEYVDGKQGPEITLPYNLDEEWNIVPLD